MLKKFIILGLLFFTFVAAVSAGKIKAAAGAAVKPAKGEEAAADADLAEAAAEGAEKTAAATEEGGKSLSEAGDGFTAKLVAFVKKQCEAIVEFINGGGKAEAGAAGSATATEGGAEGKVKATAGEEKEESGEEVEGEEAEEKPRKAKPVKADEE